MYYNNTLPYYEMWERSIIIGQIANQTIILLLNFHFLFIMAFTVHCCFSCLREVTQHCYFSLFDLATIKMNFNVDHNLF